MRGGHIIPGVSNFDDFLISLYLDISYYHTELCFITDTDFWGTTKGPFIKSDSQESYTI